MIIELVAGRLIARHLGSSLYTWTSIIGVVLAGITIGNYIGGRIADRFSPRKTLAVLFAAASVACVVIVILNNLVGQWVFIWHFNWPLRVFTHITLVFLMPSVCLGTISPVVAKMALDRGLATGRTVGDIYAWGAAGSIAGTFLAGFYLIAKMGTVSIIWSVAAALLLMAILYWARLWVLYIWAAILIALMTMGMAPVDWARQNGPKLALREKHDPTILYEDETQYCYVAVKQISENPDRRLFLQDKLKHSEISMDDPLNLQYFYTHIYAAITHGLSSEKKTISAMIIGGGGYAYPQYLEKKWPGSRIDVVEIDAGVTEAAMQAFGLSRETTINTVSMDARNYVDKLLEKKNRGMDIGKYDFIYEDAINDYSVPYQLVTREFNEKIASLLADDGVYLVNLIEIYDSGQFLGSIVHTIRQTFPHVYVLSELAPHSIRSTFVVAASMHELDLKKFIGDYHKASDIWYLDDSEIDSLGEKSGGIILTDDYVPVENMLAPVVRRSTADVLMSRYKQEAQDLKREGKLDQSVARYRDLIELEPTMSLLALNEMAIIRVQQEKLDAAADLFAKAIEYNNQAETKVNIAGIHLNLALILRQLQKSDESGMHFEKAIEGFRTELAKNPESVRNTLLLASTLKASGDLNGAADYFLKAVNLDPYDVNNHLMLAESLELQGKFDQAIAGLNKAIAFYSEYNRTQEMARMKKYLELLEFKKSKQQQ